MVQTFTYTSRPSGAGLPYQLLASGGGAAAAATGPPLMAGPGQPPSWIPTSGGAYIIQSPTANPMEMYPISSPGKLVCRVANRFRILLLKTGLDPDRARNGTDPD
jgi:hypothetical protein